MLKQTYDNQVITRYLLGALPADETERLDELSFTDDEFANALEVAEKDLIDAFVNNELSGSNLEKFNSHYLASPIRKENVRFAQSFQSFAEKNVASETIGKKAFADVQSKSKPTGIKGFFGIPSFALQWSFAAAALVLMLAGGWLLFQNTRLRSQMGQAQIEQAKLQQREKELQNELDRQSANRAEKEKELARVREDISQLERKQKELEERRDAEQRSSATPLRETSIASFTLVPSMRGIEQPATVTIPAGTGYVAMTLELESDDYSTYSVALRNQLDNRIIWRSKKLKSKTKGQTKTVTVNLRSELLRSNNYTLELAGIPQTGLADIIGGYTFKVIKK